MILSELKFLVDVGVSKKVEEYLQEQGYDTKAVRTIDARMSDQAIIYLIYLAASEDSDSDYNRQRFWRVGVSFCTETQRSVVAKIRGCYRFRETESCKQYFGKLFTSD